ncbi:MAG: IclR family transcriptional regulator [Anaerolineae bacterium]|nr:IclR family transcriptional regulator [Anaerolineae bacterium]
MPMSKAGPTMTATPRDYNISVLDSALRILQTFLMPGRTEQSLSDISQALSLNKSRTFRILATLEQHGFVEQDHRTRNYRLGLRLLELGGAVHRRLDLVQVARPILDELAEASGEAIFLGVPDGLEAVCVDKRESRHPIRLYGEVGRRSSLHVGGVPKVLLAYMVEEDPCVLERIALPKITPASVTDRTELAQLLASIRQDGYVVTLDDLDWGAHSVAAPVRDHTGRVVAAVSIAGPSERFTLDRVTQYVALIQRAGEELSARLGYRFPALEQSA